MATEPCTAGQYDPTTEELMTQVDAALAAGAEQLGKPTSVSVAGRQVSYGPASEGSLYALNMVKLQEQLFELRARQCGPWVRGQVVR
jgi:hypothetical protein